MQRQSVLGVPSTAPAISAHEAALLDDAGEDERSRLFSRGRSDRRSRRATMAKAFSAVTDEGDAAVGDIVVYMETPSGCGGGGGCMHADAQAHASPTPLYAKVNLAAKTNANAEAGRSARTARTASDEFADANAPKEPEAGDSPAMMSALTIGASTAFVAYFTLLKCRHFY